MSYQKDVLGTGPRQGGISSHFALFLTSKEANCHTICPRSSVCHLCSQRVRSHLACILLHTCERFPALPSLETSSIQVMAMRYVNSTSSACTHASAPVHHLQHLVNHQTRGSRHHILPVISQQGPLKQWILNQDLLTGLLCLQFVLGLSTCYLERSTFTPAITTSTAHKVAFTDDGHVGSLYSLSTKLASRHSPIACSSRSQHQARHPVLGPRYTRHLQSTRSHPCARTRHTFTRGLFWGPRASHRGFVIQDGSLMTTAPASFPKCVVGHRIGIPSQVSPRC